jgi:hypothetical protein
MLFWVSLKDGIPARNLRKFRRNFSIFFAGIFRRNLLKDGMFMKIPKKRNFFSFPGILFLFPGIFFFNFFFHFKISKNLFLTIKFFLKLFLKFNFANRKADFFLMKINKLVLLIQFYCNQVII